MTTAKETNQHMVKSALVRALQLDLSDEQVKDNGSNLV